MEFKTTTTYEEDLKKLSRKLPTIKKDICKEFRNKSIEEIFAKKYCLHDSGNHKVIKIRIANSEQSKGKSSGFRIIVIVDKVNATVTFIALFSKASGYKTDNLPKEELRRRIKSYKNDVLSMKLTLIKIEEYV